jgi:hypothetical protein
VAKVLLLVSLLASVASAQVGLNPAMPWSFKFDWDSDGGVVADTFRASCGTAPGTFTYNTGSVARAGSLPYEIPFSLMTPPFLLNVSYFCTVQAETDDPLVSTFNPEISFVFPSVAGPIAHWKFDENNGTVASDASGNGHTGTLAGGANFNPQGKINRAVLLDGAGDWVDVVGLLGEPSSLTISLWINTTGLAVDGAHVFMMGDWMLYMALGTGNSIVVSTQIGPSVWNDSETSAIPFLNQGWRHLVYIFDDGNDSRSLYVDGVLLDYDSEAGSMYWDNGGNTRIGANATDGSSEFIGRIDDVRLYNWALSDTDVQQIYRDANSRRRLGAQLFP